MKGIGSLNEKALHAALKDWYVQPGDRVEVPLDGYVIDIVRDDLLIELQTRNFSAIKTKLRDLTKRHPVRLLYPLAAEKWIVKWPTEERPKSSRRKSPKRGKLLDVFHELVSLPELLLHPNFSLHVLLIQEEEVRRHDPRRGWRRKGWVTHERRLLEVQEEVVFDQPDDFAFLLPEELPSSFTTAELAQALQSPRHFAQKMAYCLVRMQSITQIGKRGNAKVYRRGGGARGDKSLSVSPER